MQQQMKRLIGTISGAGTLHAKGDYTGAVYTIPNAGALVHPLDAEGILAQERVICCDNDGVPRRVQPFYEGKPTHGRVEFVYVPEEKEEAEKKPTRSTDRQQQGESVGERAKKPQPHSTKESEDEKDKEV